MISPYKLQHAIALTLLIASMGWIADAMADTTDEMKWYDVELVMFSSASESRLDDEQWPLPLYNQDEWQSAISINALGRDTGNKAYGSAAGFELLKGDKYQLNREAAQIKRSSGFELLYHIGWRQPGLPREQAIPVRISISSGEPVQVEQAVHAMAFNLNKGGQGFDTPPLMPRVSGPQLDGTVKVILSRYLHVETDLVYLLPNKSAASANGPESIAASTETLSDEPQTTLQPAHYLFHIKDSRRMRSQETHYIDHPMLGIIVRITPAEAPAVAE